MLIALCAALLVTGSEPDPKTETVPVEAVVVDSGPTWHDLSSDYREQLLHDIRKEYLIAKTGIKEALAARIVTSIDAEAEKYELDPNRLLALIIVESFGNPNAESSVGALGLMQVMPATGEYIARKSGFRWSGVEELRVVESNISYGTWYYDHLLEQFADDDHAAIAAYNWGPENIRSRIQRGKTLPRVYPGKVYAAQEELQGVIWNEYQSRFWRGIDQYVSDAREREHAARSASGSGYCKLPSSDGESVCVRDGESIPASPRNLSR
jgi:hypothetical protein